MQTLNTTIQILTVIAAIGALFTYYLGKNPSWTDERKKQIDDSFNYFVAAFLFFGVYNFMAMKW